MISSTCLERELPQYDKLLSEELQEIKSLDSEQYIRFWTKLTKNHCPNSMILRIKSEGLNFAKAEQRFTEWCKKNMIL